MIAEEYVREQSYLVLYMERETPPPHLLTQKYKNISLRSGKCE
jgi:hypothetical protein